MSRILIPILLSAAFAAHGTSQQRITYLETNVEQPSADVVGDFDGDGRIDLVHTAINTSTDRVAIRIVVAATGQLVREIVGPPRARLSSTQVRGVGDTSGDGRDDVAFAEWIGGSVEVFGFGANAPLLTIVGGATGFARSIDGVGDINNDGFADFVVGTTLPLPTGDTRAEVFSGFDGSSIRSTSVEFLPDIVVRGVGDVSGDGVADYAYTVSQGPSGTLDSGAVFDGANGAELFRSQGLELALYGSDDFTGDGVDDVIVRRNAILFGVNSGVAQWARIEPRGAEFINSVAWVGDLNQDGSAEVVIPNRRAFGSAGMLEVVSGMDGRSLSQIIVGNTEIFEVVRAGDVNGNGTDDLIVVTGRDSLAQGAIEVVDIAPTGPRTERIVGSSCGAQFRPLTDFAGAAAIGSTLTPKLSGAAFSSRATLLIGEANATPLDALGFAGCTLYAQPFATISTMTDGTGTARIDLPVPADPSLTGLAISMQWVIEVPSSLQPIPIELTNALQIVLGS